MVGVSMVPVKSQESRKIPVKFSRVSKSHFFRKKPTRSLEFWKQRKSMKKRLGLAKICLVSESRKVSPWPFNTRPSWCWRVVDRTVVLLCRHAALMRYTRLFCDLNVRSDCYWGKQISHVLEVWQMTGRMMWVCFGWLSCRYGNCGRIIIIIIIIIIIVIIIIVIILYS